MLLLLPSSSGTWYWCIQKVCNCRKPGTGMFEMAEKDFPVDRAASYMIGDKLLDTEAGQKFGVTSILVGTGYGAELHKEQQEENGENLGQHSGYWKEKNKTLGITDKNFLQDRTKRVTVQITVSTFMHMVGGYWKEKSILEKCLCKCLQNFHSNQRWLNCNPKRFREHIVPKGENRI